MNPIAVNASEVRECALNFAASLNRPPAKRDYMRAARIILARAGASDASAIRISSLAAQAAGR